MRTNLLVISILVFFSFNPGNSINAQTCSFGGGFAVATGAITQTVGNSSCFDRAFSLGDDITLSSLVIGGEYTVETCGESAPSNHPAGYNSYIGVWTTGGGFISESLGGNCGDGDDESITFTATATSHIVQLRDESCNTGISFHDLCVTYNSAPLPVELKDFSVNLIGEDALLSWETETELQNEKFDIEKSLNGRDFLKIGEVKGNGTTTEPQNYSFLDENDLLGGIVYYRLKQLDFDGQFEYSKIISLNTGEKKDFKGKFYPNPNDSGLVNFSLEGYGGNEIIISVYNLTGKLLINQKQKVFFENENLSFDFSTLIPGVYIVKFGNQTKLNCQKLIIE